MIMNDPTRDITRFMIFPIVMYEDKLGLSQLNEDIKAAILASLKNNEPMYASCDVGKQYNSAASISILVLMITRLFLVSI